MDVVGCRTFYRGLISIFTFDIPKIPSGCREICSRCIAHSCTPVSMGLFRPCESCISRKTH